MLTYHLNRDNAHDDAMDFVVEPESTLMLIESMNSPTLEWTVTQFVAAQKQGTPLALMDVRTEFEFKTAHADGAISMPIHQLEPSLIKNLQSEGKTVCVICQSGSRSAKAIRLLESKGCQGLINIRGGTSEWLGAGLPTIRATGVISAERQVSILAGIMVLSGLAGAYFLHPACIGLSVFMGLALIVSGIFDWCGMGILLSKMPWTTTARN